MIVVRLFLTMPRVCLQFVIVFFPDHTHLLFVMIKYSLKCTGIYEIKKTTFSIRKKFPGCSAAL